jgi:hypothetical protein
MDAALTPDMPDDDLAEAEARMRASLGLPSKGGQPKTVIVKHRPKPVRIQEKTPRLPPKQPLAAPDWKS